MRLISLLLLTISVCDMFATDGKDEPVTPSIPMRPGSPFPTNRPRIPSNQLIWFSYNNVTQQCELSTNVDIEYLTVTIEQVPAGFYHTENVSTDNPTISIAIPSGYYRITCITDDDGTYIGEGEIN